MYQTDSNSILCYYINSNKNIKNSNCTRPTLTAYYVTAKKKDRQHNGQKKKDRQYNGQKKKDRQHNGQKKKDRRTNNL